MNDNTALFIFDFDGTLVKSSLHNYIGERLWGRIVEVMKTSFFQSDKDRDQMISNLTKKFSIELTKDFLADDELGWKNKEQLILLFKNIILSGHKIAIASFNDYPDAIKYTMEQLLGKEDAAKIYIKSALPATNFKEIQLCNKVPYIKEIMNNTEIKDKAKVFFMDDNPNNVIAAKEFGIKTVLVNKQGREYIQEAFNFLYEFNEKHEIYVDLEHPHTEPLYSNEDESYLEQDITTKNIGFNPLFNDYHSDSEYTPWEEGNVPVLGN